MSELLFECYGVPSISYCVDGMLSYHRNNLNRPDGLLVNIGNYTTHVTPVLDGFADAMNTRRIRMGGLHLTKFLWRWLQLRFPQHLNAVTLSRAEVNTHECFSEFVCPSLFPNLFIYLFLCGGVCMYTMYSQKY